MAVQSSVKMSRFDDFDDDEDDQPICFKRTSQPSKQNQAKTEVKKPSSLPQDGQPRVHNSNGQSSNSQKAKMAQPSRPPSKLPPLSSLKSPVVSPKPSTLSGKVSPPMSRPANPKISSSPANPKRSPSPVNPKISSSPANPKRSPSPVNPKASPSPIDKHSSRESTPITKKEPDSDSDDDKPLSTRRFSSSNNTKGVGPSNPSHSKNLVNVKASADESDDEKPIALKYARKSDVGTSASKPNVSSKPQQNGLALREDQKKPSVMSSKRPLDDRSVSSSQPPVKKPKLSDAVPASKSMLSAKPEPDDEDEDEDDHVPISQRLKKTPAATSANKSSSSKPKLKTAAPQKFKKTAKKFAKDTKKSQYSMSTKMLPSGDGQKKWTTLVHSGVIFPPPYKRHGVKMLYNGKPVDLTQEQEEVATMYAMMKDTDYMQKDKFKENFWNDWKKILGSKHVIQKLDLCDFTPIYDWYQVEKEKKKNMTKEEKNALKEEKMKLEEKYMWAIVDGVKEKVGNFRVEPPGLFRGRGEHPKMGKLKKRIHPGDITINIGKGAPVPECPIPGQKWKEVRHDNTVTWLAYWNDPINPKELKYVFLAASSSLKGQSDKEKYEKARLLKTYIKNIRAAYEKDFTHKNAAKKQIAVATYLIDKLALRAGNEKDEDEADTVGCCTLKVENVKAISPNSLEFNFLGKDSIRYENTVEVELPVYKAILQFQTGKKPDEPLFDELDTSKLNAHLKELMPGLTAKVFRTYNASITLDDMLNKETKEGDIAAKILVYQRANKEVAIICNHQRSVSKSHAAQMTKLTEKIEELNESMEELRVDLERARKGKPPLKDAEGKTKRNLSPEAIEKKMNQTQAKIDKMERDKHTKDDLKTVALGTSKINYLDPRITVAWCKRHDVPIEKIFNKSLLGKFAWAMDVEPEFRF